MLPGGRGTNPTTRARGRGRGGLRGARAANNDGRGGIKRQARFNDGGVPSGPAGSRHPGVPRGVPGSLQATRTSRNAAPSARGIPTGRAGSTAVRSHDAPQGGDMAAFAQRYQVVRGFLHTDTWDNLVTFGAGCYSSRKDAKESE